MDIRQPVLDAYAKSSDLPLYVFIDTNLPPADSDEIRERWMGEIDQTMMDLAAEGYANPCPANTVLFTNDCSPYLVGEQIGKDRDRLWIRPYTANTPRVPHPEIDMCQRLVTAHAQRLVRIPGDAGH